MQFPSDLFVQIVALKTRLTSSIVASAPIRFLRVISYHVFYLDFCWGGYKMSGFGRELGMQAMDLYTQVKSVFVDLNM